VPLKKDFKDSLARQGMQSLRGFHKKGLAEMEKAVGLD